MMKFSASPKGYINNIKFMATFKYDNKSMTYSKTTADSKTKTNEEILNEFLR